MDEAGISQDLEAVADRGLALAQRFDELENDEVRDIRDEMDRRVTALLADLVPTYTPQQGRS